MICSRCGGTLETCGHLHPAGTPAEIAAQHLALIDGGFLPARGESPIQTVRKHLDAAALETARRDFDARPELALKPCPSCRLAWTPGGGTCGRCRRLAAVGVLVEFIQESESWSLTNGHGFDVVDALDALADLLRDRAELVRAHRKELRDAERDAQEAARDGYAAGALDERERNET